MSEFPMDQLTVEELLDGLQHPDYKSMRQLLLDILINLTADGIADQSPNESSKQSSPDSLSVPYPRFLPVFELMLKLAGDTNHVHSCGDDSISQRREANIIMDKCFSVLINCTIAESQCETFMTMIDHSALLRCRFERMLLEFLQYNPQTEPRIDNFSNIIPEVREDIENQGARSGVKWNDFDGMQSFGSLMCNICQLEEGRRILISGPNSKDRITALLQQVYSRNTMRRKGAVGCIRSCLFDKDIHWWMVEEAQILTPLLVPLVAPIPFDDKDKDGMDPKLWLKVNFPFSSSQVLLLQLFFTYCYHSALIEALDNEKVIEPDHDIIKMLLECLVLLCQRRLVREIMRERKVYPVIRNLHLEKNEVEDTNELIYQLVDFLMGEEDPDTPVT